MPSSRVMPSSSSASPQLARQASMYSPTISELQGGDPAAKGFGSVSPDDLLRLYGDGASSAGVGEGSLLRTGDNREEIATAEDGSAAAYAELTLEVYLARNGAIREEDVGVPSGSATGSFAVDSFMGDRFGQQPQFPPENPILGFVNGAEGGGGGGSGRGRGRKRPVLDPVDRDALQRQKRMIKNRESAARSRERKQAYTVELESLVTQLEEENARLVREQKELIKERRKQLMENLIPVTESKKPPKPPCALRRTRSMPQSMPW